MGICATCGNEVLEGARICGTCGSPYSPQQPGAAGPFTASGQPPSSGPATWQAPQSLGAGGAVAAAPTDGQAIAALVCGIAGLVFCPVILSIVAIVLGKSSMKRIEASGGALQGHQLAKAGYITGIVGVALGVLGLLIMFLFMGALITGGALN